MIYDSLHTLNPLKTHHALFQGIAHTRVRLAHGRLQFLMVLISCLFFVLCIRMVDLSVLGPEAALAPTLPTQSRLYLPVRSPIYDREGQLLALSVPSNAAYIRQDKMLLEPDVLVKKIAAVLKKPSLPQITKGLKEGKQFVWISRKLTPAQRENLLRIGDPGILFEAVEQRIYIHGAATAHILGEVDIDGAGVSGLEKTFDQQLTKKGPLHTSIDMRCQQIMYDHLGKAMEKFKATGANALVLKISTGEVIASVSLPSFTPGHQEILPQDAHFNRNTLGVYEVGSTMKIVNTVMALESGVSTIDTKFNTVDPLKIGNFRIQDYRPADCWMSLEEIFVKSSNIGSVRISQAVGLQEQKTFFRHLGLLGKPTLELPEIGAPLYPKNWTEANAMTMSYGYGISLSPIHFAGTVCTLIGDGSKITPTFLKVSTAEERPRLIKEKTAHLLREMMHRTVTEGTARQSNVKDYVVLGKTGTANLREGRKYVKGRNMTSYVGAVGSHVDHHEYLVLVMLEAPQGTKESFGLNAAGWNAAPTGGAIIADIAPLLNISPAHFHEKKISAFKKSRGRKTVKNGSITTPTELLLNDVVPTIFQTRLQMHEEKKGSE